MPPSAPCLPLLVSLLLLLGLLLTGACQQPSDALMLVDDGDYLSHAPLPQRPAARLLFPQQLSVAAPYLLQDLQEGYFDQITLADVRLQWPSYPADTLDLAIYRSWLREQYTPWPPDLAAQIAQDWAQVLAESEALFPALAPDTIVLIAMQDAPYGAHIYFTRQRAVMLPLTDIQTAEKEDLLAIYRHELFHLISRQYPEARPGWYALANYESAPAMLHWASPLHKNRLTNPDAPNFGYVLRHEGQRYLPLLYHPDTLVTRDAQEAFAENLRLTFLALSHDTVTASRLPEWHARVASEANSHYFIHPEEVLAEHFSLLLGGQKKVLYPAELEDLKRLLLALER